MTGSEPGKTGWFGNWQPAPDVRANCGSYLAEEMQALGYRTWGFGKFHTEPRTEPLGFEVHEYSEELWEDEETFLKDDYVAWLRSRSSDFDHIEQVHGERTDMYYAPQLRPQPAELCGENWLATRAVEELQRSGSRPFFGFVSFVQPHPPLAPPVPYNRMFDPDAMPSPVTGDPRIDKVDDYLGWMNYAVYAESISPLQAKQARARYYASITFIDDCIGRILDAVEALPDPDNTVICFFSDHGDFLGDHGAWQKESFFEASARIPMLISWPKSLKAGSRHEGFATLTDLFGLATSASGKAQLRDGHDFLGALRGDAPNRAQVIGMHGQPGTRQFKAMVRKRDWKYLWFANGGYSMLFNVANDPSESACLASRHPDLMESMRRSLFDRLSSEALTRPSLNASGDGLLDFPFEPFERTRIKQFARGISDYGQGPSGFTAGK